MTLHTYKNANREPDGTVDERATQTHELAKAVSAELGDGWRAEGSNNGSRWAYLIRAEDGLVLMLHGATKNYDGPIERWAIHGAVWPEGNDYGLPDASMTVAVSKTPKQIAGDIKRRVLELARANHEAVKLTVIGYALNDHKDWKLAQRLTALDDQVKIASRTDQHNRYRQPEGVYIRGSYTPGKPELDAKFYSGGHSAELRYLSDDQLVELAKLVATWNA